MSERTEYRDPTRYRLVAGTINRYRAEDGWENVHVDVSPRAIWHPGLDMGVLPEFVADIASMPQFRDAMFDEVRAHHVLEHLTGDHGRLALREFNRILVPGGCLDVEVPDMDEIAKAWLDRRFSTDELQQWIYGEQLSNHEPGDSHRYAWDNAALRTALSDAGFLTPTRMPGDLALRFRALTPTS